MFNLAKLLSVIILVIIIWGGLFTDIAVSGLLESRLNNLESRFYRLESQVNRIEMQGNRGSSSPKIPNTSLPSQRSGRRLSQSERDKMFDRLSTLVIELRQDVNQLQKRVSQLENTDN
ncbi:hypothetical protein IQ247_19120 [Plectonema cf. radiosum LEGE 06105]|uniref:Uncharacterized protein n=1 Tax=Plectonema cf. radiosum LEGE 06105 TaxID=945769 RepID=A0A8J7JU90_9CYAN|nr:hypothetical protein [Plectonema radiosum]MBE9214754.1 hypothetical protein [Plectonema cf. radiosum LEGE 06105]